MPQPQSVLNFANVKSTSDYVIIKPFEGFPTQAVTVELWLKTRAKAKNANSTPFSYAVSRQANEFALYRTPSLFVFVQDNQKESGISFSDGQWHHCAATWESSTGQIKLYKDGQSVFSKTVSKNIFLRSLGAVVIGQEQDKMGGSFELSDAFQGQLSEVRIWDRIRTAEEIQTLMGQRCTGQEEGLVACWPLDEGAGKIANDKTSNAKHGTIRGATWVTVEDLTVAPAKSALIASQLHLDAEHTPAAQPRTNATGLEDYVYWWKEVAQQQEEKGKTTKTFRRGRIWQ